MPSQGSVYQRASDGKWVGSLLVDGRRKVVYGSTDKEARRKLDDLRQQATRDGGLALNCTLSEVLDRWIEAESSKWKPRTLSDYRHVVDDVIGPALGSVRLPKLSPTRLQAFYASVAKQSSRKAYYCHQTLHRALHVAVLWGTLPTNPCDRVVPPRTATKQVSLWTPDEVRAFVQGVEGHWLEPYYLTALHTGCRAGELCALRWSDYDADTRTLAVQRSAQKIRGEWIETLPKTRSGRRTLSVSPALAGALRRQKAQQAAWKLQSGREWVDSGLIFTDRRGQILSQSTTCHALHRLADGLGVPRVGLHALRHISASVALRGGVSLPMVSRRLGHANTAITAAIYSHALTGDEQAAEAVSRALSG